MNNNKNLKTKNHTLAFTKRQKKFLAILVCAALAFTVFAVPAAAAGDVDGLNNMISNTQGLLWTVLQGAGVIAIAVGAGLFIIDLFGQGTGQKIAHIGMILGGIALYNMETIVAMVTGG